MKKILLSVFLVLALAIPAVAQDMRRGSMPGPTVDTPKEEMVPIGSGAVGMKAMSVMTSDSDYFDCDEETYYATGCPSSWPWYWGHSQNYFYIGGYGSVFSMVELKGYGTVKTRFRVIDALGIVQYDSGYYPNTLASSGWQQWRYWGSTYFDFAPGVYTVQVTWKVGTVSLVQTAKVRVD
jgi:hypothetical protein